MINAQVASELVLEMERLWPNRLPDGSKNVGIEELYFLMGQQSVIAKLKLESERQEIMSLI